ncbi:E3 ubiquitin-protein ligase RHA2B-like [Tasmannia lanceolata]|uniref:E3 ubiquitin-protein ligase RHA2B-like n=1 Tax=Tasmannia lanceolata TaxID=3420 RepID=UPI0040645439
MKNLVSFIFQALGLKQGPKKANVLIKLCSLESTAEECFPIDSAKEKRSTDVDGECCVCLSMLEEGDGTRKLPCRHLFHEVCVDRWLNLYGRTCPLCRMSVVCGQVSSELAYKREELTEEMVIWFSSFHVAGF